MLSDCSYLALLARFALSVIALLSVPQNAQKRKQTQREGMIITIQGEFPSLNEYIAASKIRAGSYNKGAAMKRRDQTEIAAQLPRRKINTPIRLHYRYYCRTRRRDLDNISGYFHKVFQDALVERGLIPDDSWRHVIGFSDSFTLDRKNPRIEIEIEGNSK